MKKKYIFPIAVLFIVLVFVVFGILPRSQYEGANPWIIEKGDRPNVIAHAGGADLFPANTILAFEESMKLGVDILELDLRLTEDDVLITHHDKTLDRLSNGTGNIRNFTYAEILAFDFAAHFVGVNNENYRPEFRASLFGRYPEFSEIGELLTTY